MNTRYLVSAILAGGILAAGLVVADDDDAWESGARAWERNRLDFAPASDPGYREECGSCHFAYQPGLLPARSWNALLADLENHFGDDASVDDATRGQLTGYLEANAADRSKYKRPGKMMRSLAPGATPLRYSETRYFRRKHHEIPDRLVENNPNVSSFSNCGACHAKAETGSYDEHQVNIPGVGRWDD